MARGPIMVAPAITARRVMKRDLYAEVSARIVAELEAGAAPWVKPWSATPGANTPCNAVSNRPYSGCNVVLLWMVQAAGYAGLVNMQQVTFTAHGNLINRNDLGAQVGLSSY